MFVQISEVLENSKKHQKQTRNTRYIAYLMGSRLRLEKSCDFEASWDLKNWSGVTKLTRFCWLQHFIWSLCTCSNKYSHIKMSSFKTVFSVNVSIKREKVWKPLSIAHHQRLQPSKKAVNEGDADMICHPPSLSAEALESALHAELPLNSSQLADFFFFFLSLLQRLWAESSALFRWRYPLEIFKLPTCRRSLRECGWDGY